MDLNKRDKFIAIFEMIKWGDIDRDLLFEKTHN